MISEIATRASSSGCVCFWFAACWPEINGCDNVFSLFVLVSVDYLCFVSLCNTEDLGE